MPSAKHYQAICAHVVRLLREERERRGLSKYAVAQRSGVSEPMIGYVERGLRRPSLEIAMRIADALDIDLPTLITKAHAAVTRRK